MDNFQLAQIRSRQEVVDFLDRIYRLREVIREIYEGRSAVILHMLEDILKFWPEFKDSLYQLKKAESKLALKKKYRNQARLYMIEVTRDFWSVASKLHRRKRYGKGWLRFYRSRGTGHLKLSDARDWQYQALEFVKGDGAILRAGLQGMTNPSPEELTAAVENFEQYCYFDDEVDVRERRRALKKMIAQAQAMHGRLAKELRHFHREATAQNLRGIMRGYGFRFINTTKRDANRKQLEADLPVIEEVIPEEELGTLALEAPSVLDEIDARLERESEVLERELEAACLIPEGLGDEDMPELEE